MSSPRNNKNKKLVFGSVVLLGAFGLLVAGGMQSSTLKAIPVGELLSKEAQAQPQTLVGQRLRVVGFVGHEPVRRVVDDSSNADGGAGSTQYFIVHDEDKKITVEYRDALPETFKAGSPVQVDGVYYESGKLRADRVLTKCPSKYQAEEVDKATSDMKSKKDKSYDKTKPSSEKTGGKLSLAPQKSTS